MVISYIAPQAVVCKPLACGTWYLVCIVAQKEGWLNKKTNIKCICAMTRSTDVCDDVRCTEVRGITSAECRLVVAATPRD